MGRAFVALVLANARYWTTVAPVVRVELTRWERSAQVISDPLLRHCALCKLREERFNVELAATLATLAPRHQRRSTVKAIVALQVLYDYLDMLTERRLPNQLRDGRALFEAFTDALDLCVRPCPPVDTHECEPTDIEPASTYYRHHQGSGEDGGYLDELVHTIRGALALLPASEAIAAPARESACRCAEAQVLSHAAVYSGDSELERWSRRAAGGSTLGWPERLAGATASVLALHALIAAAADERTTHRDAREIDEAYLSIGAITMLDSLIDHEQDLARGEHGYRRHYPSSEEMVERLGALARDGAQQAQALPHGPHHVMTLAGVVAYYCSAPAANNPFARPVTTRVRRELQPLVTPALAVMRAWRLAKRLRLRLRRCLQPNTATRYLAQRG